MNPLLQHGVHPLFDQVAPDHVGSALREILDRAETALERLETQMEPSWHGLVEPLEALQEPLGFAWRVVTHLMGVRNSDALRTAHDSVQADVVAFHLRLEQSKAIYAGLTAMRKGEEWERLDATQRRVLELALRDAELAGVGLDGPDRETFCEIQTELAELSTRFNNNVLDATKAFELILTDQPDVAGLPPSLLEATAQSARAKGTASGATAEQGPWRITLDAPIFIPFMEHCRNRQRREQVYRAFVTRASSGSQNNSGLIDRILELRNRQAGLLGYDTPAAVSIATKMAESVAAVDALTEALRAAARPAAERELDELQSFARMRHGDPNLELALWDVPFWAERQREERFAFRDEDLRPYFSFERVLAGLFALAQRLFGISIVAADGDVTVWNPDVRFFRVFSDNSEEIASFYIDAYSRPEDKRGGAWMGGCLDRSRRPDGTVRLPCAWLVCNQTNPLGDKPSLMTFDEVRTLFHEFGHGLQHMLTTIDCAQASGMNNVEWDAIEIASQFMENWCYDRDTLIGISGHFQTQEPLPEDLYQKILAARTYRSGSSTLRQLYFGMLDMELHHRYRPKGDETIADLQSRIASAATVIPPLPEDRFLCAFSHIFAGGYAAGYYSYKWAEVLSADAFAAFEEAGRDNGDVVGRIGRRFCDTILAQGGSRHPMELYREFRGRAPTIDALLRHTGLANKGGA